MTHPIRLVLMAVALLLCACSEPEQAPRGPLTLAEFERGAFLRKYPVREKHTRALNPAGQAWIYSFPDPDGEGLVTVQLEPASDRVTTLTVTFPAESADAPAAWNSIKKQFVADLLESTFHDVDYGQVSAYVLEHKGEPAGPVGKAMVRAASVGADLVVEISRPEPS